MAALDLCRPRLGHDPRPDERWFQLEARDQSADGRFFYAVVTTGVYCRPSCASRTPRPENVRYFASARAAEEAGYRPCKRCKPQNEGSLVPDDSIAAICRFLEKAPHEPSLDELASLVGWSVSHLQRTFTKRVGLSPKRYARQLREQRLRRELMRRDSVGFAMREAGYKNPGRFHAEARRALGMTPRNFKHGGANMKANYSLGKSSLGTILVAATELGVCAVFLGDDPKKLVQDLEQRFPHAELRPGGREFQRVLRKVIEFVEHPGPLPELPLDLRGTAFQKRVWDALQRIPLGERWTYAKVARWLNQPSASRAVAGACAKNPIALLVPCHRVVRSDGSLSGYRWGQERKRILLERESNS